MRNVGHIPGIGYLLVALVVVFSVSGTGFATVANALNIGVQSSVLLLLSLPMTLIIMSEGLDLSMGAVLSLSGVVLAMLLMNGRPLPVALAAALGVGVPFGLGERAARGEPRHAAVCGHARHARHRPGPRARGHRRPERRRHR